MGIQTGTSFQNWGPRHMGSSQSSLHPYCMHTRKNLEKEEQRKPLGGPVMNSWGEWGGTPGVGGEGPV